MFKYTLPLYPTPDENDDMWDLKKLRKLNSRTEINNTQQLVNFDVDSLSDRKLMPHQIVVANCMAPRSPVDNLIVMHGVGSGKTLTAVLCVINNIEDADLGVRRALILTPNRAILSNFRDEVMSFYSQAYAYSNMGDTKKVVQYVGSNYHFDTITSFANKINTMSDAFIQREWNSTFVVIDEAHDIAFDGVDYPRLNRFLKLVHHKKLLLMTATPMRNSIMELLPMYNLCRSRYGLDMTTEQFGKLRTINGDTGVEVPTDEFKRKFIAAVSYFDSNEIDLAISIVNMGRVFSPILQNTKVVTHDMSSLMTDVYETILESRTIGSTATAGGVAMLDYRQAVRFVFPDGTYGSTGYREWMNIDGTAKVKLRSALRTTDSADDIEGTLKNVAKYSVRYAEMARTVYECATRGEKSIVYDDLVTGSGLLVFAAVLEMIGMVRYKPGAGVKRRLTFVCMTREVMTVPQIIMAQQVFNSVSNVNGDQISIILGSRAIAEGLTFKDVQHEHVVAHWNDSETDQILGRGIRVGSHDALRRHNGNGGDIVVKIYRHATIYGKRPESSVDLIMYATSESKRITINNATSALRAVSLTCPSLEANSLSPIACDYTVNVQCDDNSVPLLVKSVRDSFTSRFNILYNDGSYFCTDIGHFLNEILTLDETSTVAKRRQAFILLQMIQQNALGDQFNTFVNCDGRFVYVTNSVDNFDDGRCVRYPFRIDEGDVSLRFMEKCVSLVIEPELVNVIIDSDRTYPLVKLPVNIIEMVIERAIDILQTSDDNLLSKYDKDALETFKLYYNFVDTSQTTVENAGIVASSWLASAVSREPYRVKLATSDAWQTCPKSLVATVDELRHALDDDTIARMLNKNITHYGMNNPFNDAYFCLRPISSDALSSATMKRDKRKLFTGKQCITWSLKELHNIMNHLNIREAYKITSRKQCCSLIRTALKQLNAIVDDVSCGVQAKKNK